VKILALTSIRSDYDLLSPLYNLLDKDEGIDFKLLVSGAHLSKDFGHTIDQIVKDGFEILLEIETLIHSDTPKSRLKTASLLLQNSIDIVAKFTPDVLLYAGDREDVMVGALLGTYLNIPTIHFYGGDHEDDGHQDTYIRHATSKLSSLHFVSTFEHQQRLLALGESEKRIFNIGSISLDRLVDVKKTPINDSFTKNIPKNFSLLIFHPILGEDSAFIFENILKVLIQKNIFTFVSYPNTDPGYDEINNIIKKYEYVEQFIFYKNLERDLFLNIFSKCDFIIGNSSAGIYEAATLKKAVINVGLRQKNRLISPNIIYSGVDIKNIDLNITKVTSPEFQNMVDNVKNPYGEGKSALIAYGNIKQLDLKSFVLKSEDPLKKDI